MLERYEKLLNGPIIGASLIPAKHTYLNQVGHTSKDLIPLDKIISSIPLKQHINITKFHRHPLANFFPTWRSQIGIKISKLSHAIIVTYVKLNVLLAVSLMVKLKITNVFAV